MEHSIDPETIIRADGLVLEKTFHYLRFAPFLIVVNADNSTVLNPVNHNSNITEWNPPRNSRVWRVGNVSDNAQKQCWSSTYNRTLCDQFLSIFEPQGH